MHKVEFNFPGIYGTKIVLLKVKDYKQKLNLF